MDRAKTALANELEQLYGITREANSFAALVESQKERRQIFEEENILNEKPKKRVVQDVILYGTAFFLELLLNAADEY